ncbi:T9SS type B sorting domain-containing protein [Flavobacteriaceae bacterium R38]|nr:T9SS type B sorting domain-containing protein [Flavobacteriaceae bacterium R38]
MKIFTIFSRLRIFVFIFFALSLSANLFGQSAPTFAGTQGPTLLSGTLNAVGSRYLYTDVEVNVNGSGVNADAVLTIISISNSSVNSIDTTLGVDNRFEPTTTTTAANGFIEWELVFVVDGTADAVSNGIPIPLDSYTLQAVDVDGQEFFEVVVPDSYTIQGPLINSGNLTVTTNGEFTRFESNTTSLGGIDLAESNVVSVNYTNVSRVRFRNGRVISGGARQNSVSFLGEVVFSDPFTATVNTPPVVVDNIGNTVLQNSTGNTPINVLTGSSDTEGNLDPTTVSLIDPGNPANIGIVGSPLVIAGVGTYTIDNLGNVDFTPATDYVGNADVNFRVSDTPGATSNIASLAITVLADTDGDGIIDTLDPDDDDDGNPDVTDNFPLVPTANNDALAISEGQSGNINVLTNDDFLAGVNTSLVDLGTGTAGGTVLFDNLTGELIYTPLAGEEGTTVTINYQVCNTAVTPNVCTTATVFITVIPDSDGDGIDDLTDLDDDNDGIPDNVELNCTPGSILDWDVATFTGDITADPAIGTPNVASTVINGTTVTVTSSISGGITSNFLSAPSAINGSTGLQVQGRINELNAGAITYELAFSQPVTNLNFSIVDIDQSDDVSVFPLFQERVNVTATRGGNLVGLNFSLGSAVADAGGNNFDGVDFVPTAPPSPLTNPNGNLNLTFLEAVDSITIIYTNITPNTDNSPIAILFTDLTWDCPGVDTDGDGIPNNLDLDSDNDGIYDVVESGAGLTDVDQDGRVDGVVGGNGIPDEAENGGVDGAGVSFTPIDSESTPDGIADYLELDADGDGCNDVLEAGFTDPDLDGILGGTPVTVDANGVVTSGTDGYTGTNFTVIDFTVASGCIDAINDTNTVAIGATTGGTAIADVLANDTVLGNPATLTPANVLLTVVTPSTNPGVVLNTTTGAVTVAPNTPAGTYTITYQICDAANPTSCDTAMIFVIVSPDTDGDGIPDLTDLDDDNDGIPDNVELNCTPGSILDWNVATFTGDITADPTIGTPNVASTVIDGTTVTVTSSISGGITGNFFSAPSAINGFTGLQVQGRINELNTGDITYELTFSQPVTNLNFSIVDIDRSVNASVFPLFQEQLEVVASRGGTPIDLNFSLGSAVQNTAVNTFEGINFVPTLVPAIPANPDGNLNLTFLDAVDSIVITYRNITANTDNSPITILFTDLTWDCPGVDTDGDGIPNNLDLDSDNDGIYDIVESGAGLTDVDQDGRVDGAVGGNGIPDEAENGGVDGAGVSFVPVNSFTNAGDGPDYLDIDADDDGIVDNIEGQTTAGYIAPLVDDPGTPGINEADTDGNGVNDAYDTNGTPITPTNTDGAFLTGSDTVPDYLDTDSDADGESDTIEAYDTDDDGIADTVPAVGDADADGLDDSFDLVDLTVDPVTNPTNGGQTANNPFPDTDSPGGEPNWREGLIQLTTTKTSVLDLTVAGGATIADVGDEITYTYSIENTGSVTLTSVGITETLASFTGTGTLPVPAFVENTGVTPASPAGTLVPGETATFTATYVITQADIDAGGVQNSATSTGTPPVVTGTPAPTSVTDVSDAGDELVETPNLDGTLPGDGTDNDPTVTLITAAPQLITTKTSVLDLTLAGDATVADVGDEITYTYSIENAGNVTLTSVGITETLASFTGTGTLPVPAFVENTGVTPASAAGTLAPGETATFTATYLITQADIDAGGVQNSATSTGTPPDLPDGTAATPITDVSDAGDELVETPNLDGTLPGDGTDNDPTVTVIPQAPDITLLKVDTLNDGGDGQVDVGDTIDYIFTVTNTGNVTLSNITIDDPGIINAGGPITLAPGASDNTTFTGTYTITQADIDAGNFSNTATVNGEDPLGGTVSSLSDDPDDATDNDSDGDGNPDDPTITVIPQAPNITLLKIDTAVNDGGDGQVDAGDTIGYTFTVTNTGNVTLSNITIDDPGVINAGGPITLAPGASDNTTFTGTYTILQADIDAGSFSNTATVNAEDPLGGSVSSLSDDPDDPADATDDDGDGNPDDPTVTVLPQEPGIVVLKVDTFNDENGNRIINVGETISYAFTVTNTGNVTLSNITIDDPGIVNAGSSIASLAPGASDNTTFTGTYFILQSDIDAGSFSNTATVNGEDPNGGGISSLSDDPDDATDNDNDGDGNPDDPTVTVIPQVASISLLKAASSPTFSRANEVINYTITVINTGNISLDNIVVTDVNANITGGSPIATLAPGDAAGVTAEHTITLQDVEARIFTNIAQVTANSAVGSVEDDSDDPNNPDDIDNNGDGEPDDPTVILFESDPNGDIEVFELVTPNGDGQNDTFIIGNIQSFPDNTVRIYNRWGILVFETTGYNPLNNFFDGRSEGRATIREGELLPVGTYFYVIDYAAPGVPRRSRAGHFYINR